MHFRILAYMFISLQVLSGCGEKKTGTGSDPDRRAAVEITGTMEGGAGNPLILEEMEAREFIPVDTVSMDETGTFRIAFDPPGVAFYVLRTGGTGYITLLVEPGEKPEISGSYGETFPYSVNGSKGSELLQALAAEHRQVLDALASVARRNMEMAGSPGFTEIKQNLDRQFDSITDAFRDYSLDFIHRNPGSLSILVALHNLYGEGLPVFRPDSDLEVYSFVDSALMENYSDFEAVRLLHARVEEVKRSLAETGGENMLHVGDIAPDFVSSQPDGNQVALSDLRGNYVLLSFWAGWSSLSREENRYLKTAHDRYGEEPFRILQVSLDEDREIWVEAIRDEGLEQWVHVSDLKRWESMVADLYHLEKIPSNMLLDPGGKIVGVDLFGNKLLEKLDRIFREQ